MEIQKLLDRINEFILKFTEINKKFRNGIYLPNETKELLIEYTDFIINPKNKNIWEMNINTKDSYIKSIIENAQRESAYCVCIMEKYRAEALFRSNDSPADYFKNIENCIENEFKYLQMNENSNVLLIGVGSFPMTPLIIAKNIGASVLGLDIDEEAVKYARKVIDILGINSNIEVSTKNYAEFDFTKKATHIIIASTILEKFDILNNLYSLTNKDVIVMMRYGNGFKSLFNYPLIEVLETPWRKIENICYENNVFDVAVYKK